MCIYYIYICMCVYTPDECEQGAPDGSTIKEESTGLCM